MGNLFLRMSHQDIERYDIIKRLIRGQINGTDASKQLRLSVRQTKRLKAGVKQHGLVALCHGNRGKPGHRRVSNSERARIVTLVSEKYFDFTPTFAAEKLAEQHHIKRDPKTIQAVMVTAGVWSKRTRRKKEQRRAWRERRLAYGDLIQFDGSYEHWFEERGGESCLLAAIDDATGIVVRAVFAEHEGVVPVCGFWEAYLIQNGKPLAIYLDKFSTYRMNQPVAKENTDTLTQFGRAMQELRIEVIHAHSPQAKGRVERLFQTLQDRLIKELRLNRISDLETANQFLTEKFIPAFNAKFAVEPRSRANRHRALTKHDADRLPAILCRHEERTVRSDYTISYQNQWYQLSPEQPVTIFKKDKVLVEERRDGTNQIRLRGKYLNYQLLPGRPLKVTKKQPWVLPARERATFKPPANHPWRLRLRADARRAELTKV